MSSPRILFVDDEPAVLRTFRGCMRGAPWEVQTARSADEGLSVMDVHPVDVVVSDERMPGMSGAEFLSLVRQRYPATERILLTGHADLDAVVRAVNTAEVFRFLTKPCRPVDLRRCIDAALRRRQQPLGSDLQREAERRLATFLDDMALHVQPIVRIRDRQVVAYEALLRSPSARGPVEVLTTAQMLGRTLDVDRAVCRHATLLVGSLPAEISLFVNLASRSLWEPEALLHDNPILDVADRVVLEITEGAFAGDAPPGPEAVALLRSHGFRVAIDDLGAGHNGLVTLADLSPDVVKFDRALLRDVETHTIRQRVLRAMVDLAHADGIETVAEGVETASQLEAALRLGCDLAQGYFLGRPGPWPPTTH